MKIRTVALFAVVAMTVATSHAINVSWVGGSSGNWTNAANWNAGVPTSGDKVRFYIDNEGATIDSNVGLVDRLELGREATGITLALNTGGVLAVNQFRIAAKGVTDDGTMNINGGALTISGGTHGIGYNGTGVVNLNSGSFTSTADLALGWNLNSSGTMNINGGTLDVAGSVQVGGLTANGVPQFAGVTGVFNLSGGTVTASRINVGKGGDGTLTITGGNMTVGTFRAQTFDGLTGVINLMSGTVDAETIFIGQNGTLNLATAATLITSDIVIESNGLMIWQGNRTTDISDMVKAGELSWANAAEDEGKEFDQEFVSGANVLRSFFNGTNTEVWTVVPGITTLGLVRR